MTAARHLGVLLTSRCNLTCGHCLQSRRTKVELASDRLVGMIGEAAKLGIGGISFSGGEPTLYPHLGRAADACRTAGVPYSLTSNGTQPHRLLRAAAIHPPHHVTISLDGMHEADHDGIRGTGMFQRSAATARMLAAIGLSVRLQFTITRAVAAAIGAVASLLDRTGADEAVLIPLTVDRRGLAPPAGDILRLQEQVGRLRDSGVPVTIAFGPGLLDGSRNWRCPYLSGESLFVDWHGNIGLCCQLGDGRAAGWGIVAPGNRELVDLIAARDAWLTRLIPHLRPTPPGVPACHGCRRALRKVVR